MARRAPAGGGRCSRGNLSGSCRSLATDAHIFAQRPDLASQAPCGDRSALRHRRPESGLRQGRTRSKSARRRHSVRDRPLHDARSLVQGSGIPKVRFGADRIAAKEVHILIIGESARRDSWSVYGYSRPTTPYLDKSRGQAIFFQHAVADANVTICAVPILLTGMSPSRFDLKAVQGNLVGLADEAGYSTAWLMNQDPHISLLTGIHADRMVYPPSLHTLASGKLPLDQVLLPEVRAQLEHAHSCPIRRPARDRLALGVRLALPEPSSSSSAPALRSPTSTRFRASPISVSSMPTTTAWPTRIGSLDRSSMRRVRSACRLRLPIFRITARTFICSTADQGMARRATPNISSIFPPLCG